MSRPFLWSYVENVIVSNSEGAKVNKANTYIANFRNADNACVVDNLNFFSGWTHFSLFTFVIILAFCDIVFQR